MDIPQNCILTQEELLNNPSIREGMSEEEEFKYRCFSCELIRDGCILLELSPAVSASGQIICHRFYYYYSFINCHPFFISMACVLIASKIEEELRPVSRIIKIFHSMYLHRTNQEIKDLEDTDSEFVYWRKILMETEKLILSVFGYHFYGITDHPHKFVLFFIKKLHLDSMMAQRAWNILNDCQQLPLCLEYSSNTIACAAIYLAAMTLEIPLPAMEWWELFDSTAEDIQAITQKIIQLYQRSRLDWLDDMKKDACQFNFACYESIWIGSPSRINLRVKILTTSEMNQTGEQQEKERKTKFDVQTRERSRSYTNSHTNDHSHSHSRHHRDDYERSHSHHRRDHSRRRSRSHDRDSHSHRRHHHHH